MNAEDWIATKSKHCMRMVMKMRQEGKSGYFRYMEAYRELNRLLDRVYVTRTAPGFVQHNFASLCYCEACYVA